MASVFLSYDHEDARRAAPIAAALEAHGHSVWWDQQIHGGAEYNSAIETAVERSDAVVVLWSEKSVRSAWVRDEAAEGRDAGKLVPVLIDAVKAPMGFRQYQTLDLSGWTGGKRIPCLPELLRAIDAVAGAEPRAAPPPTPVPRSPARVREGLPRRAVLGAGAAAGIAALAGGGIWWSAHQRLDPRVKAAIDKADDALRHGTADERTVQMLERAASIQPDSAVAWGRLALVSSLIAQGADPDQAASVVDKSQKAAQRALAIDPKEPNALLAMFELQGSALDWFTRDRRLREIISIDPKNVGAIAELVLLTQATGFCRESWDWNERAIALEPLSADFLGKRALKLWILGRTSQADKVSDQVRALYPTDQWPWFVRLTIYAFTGRPGAALAMLDSEPAMAARSPLTPLLRATLPALDAPSPGAAAKARDACIKAAAASPQLADIAVQLMCALKDTDAAFDIADGVLLSRGPMVVRQRPGSGNAVQNAAWRISTQWMFTPPAAAMRADRRFLPLCDGVGLTDYWRSRGLKPDYMRARA